MDLSGLPDWARGIGVLLGGGTGTAFLRHLFTTSKDHKPCNWREYRAGKWLPFGERIMVHPMTNGDVEFRPFAEFKRAAAPQDADKPGKRTGKTSLG